MFKKVLIDSDGVYIASTVEEGEGKLFFSLEDEISLNREQVQEVVGVLVKWLSETADA